MARRKSLNGLQRELRGLLLSIREGDNDPGEKARAHLECARQSLDCFDDAAGAAGDAREALRLACDCGADPSPYRSMLFRALFRAGNFGELIDLADETGHNEAEGTLWSGMARFCVRGEFPALKGSDLPLIPPDTLLEYALLAHRHGFTRLARMAAANARSFLLNDRRERVMAECYFDEGSYAKAARIYRTRMEKDRTSGALFVRYADCMALAGRYGEAIERLEKTPPADELLARLLTYNLHCLSGDVEAMGRALARMGLVSRGVLYFHKRACYFRARGAFSAALRSLETARALLPRSIDPLPHERAIGLALDCEEALIRGEPSLAAPLLPALGALPVTESLIYKRQIVALARGTQSPGDDAAPWSPLDSPWLKAVVALMFLLIFFLIYLDTKFGWLTP
jgi:tetratricopeptide (TPR) repeat protein